MSDAHLVKKFEDFPNEILIDCFEYFHTADLFHSFSRLNHRFSELIRILPLHLDFQDIRKSFYDDLCTQMLVSPETQRRVYSLRLSNRNTVGQIEDFLSKFELDQLCNLRSLTFIDVQENNIQPLKQVLPKLSQIITLNLLDSQMKLNELESSLFVDNLQTLSLNSNMAFVQQTVPIQRLILSSMSLDEICNLFQYTPFLRYLDISCVREGVLSSVYNTSPRPAALKHLIFGDFHPLFNDLRDFLQNLSSVQNFTIGSSSDRNMLDASRWEQFITTSLPRLKNFQFKLIIDHRMNPNNVSKIFDRFQTEFWLIEHQWYTECSVNKQSMMIYTVPCITQFRQVSLAFKRYCNSLIDNSQTFKLVNNLTVSGNDLFEHGNYYFPNITSLIITQAPNLSTESNEERVMDSLVTLMNFSQLKHLELPLDCQTQRPTLLFQILDLAPQLSSLRTKPCFIESLLNQPQSRRYLNDRIRKLDISDYTSHRCKKPVKVRSVQQLIPNLEQLTTSITDINDLFFLLNRFPKLSSFTVHFMSRDGSDELDIFKRQASQRDATFHQSMTSFRNKFLITLSVWIRTNSQ